MDFAEEQSDESAESDGEMTKESAKMQEFKDTIAEVLPSQVSDVGQEPNQAKKKKKGFFSKIAGNFKTKEVASQLTNLPIPLDPKSAESQALHELAKDGKVDKKTAKLLASKLAGKAIKKGMHHLNVPEGIASKIADKAAEKVADKVAEKAID